MIQTTIIEEGGAAAFLPNADDSFLSGTDLMIGAVDDETNTACGILLARLPEQKEFALSVRLLTVAEEYRDKGVEKLLLRRLEDIAADIGASAVYASVLVYDTPAQMESEASPQRGRSDGQGRILLPDPIDGEGEASADPYLEAGFDEEDSLPLMGFPLSAVQADEPGSGCGCRLLSELSKEQWDYFCRQTAEEAFTVRNRKEYEENISVFLTDDQKEVCAGMLIRKAGDRLFIDGISAYGKDEKLLLNDLAFWAKGRGEQCCGPETIVMMYQPSGYAYLSLFRRLTGNSAKKIGELKSYICVF